MTSLTSSVAERRAYRRVETSKRAVIAYNEERHVFLCTVLNVSASGALVRLDEPALLPDDVTLIIPNEDFFAACKVAWARGRAYGVHFVDGPYVLVGETICPVNREAPAHQPAPDNATAQRVTEIV